MNRFLNQTFGKKNSRFKVVQIGTLWEGIIHVVEIIVTETDPTNGIGF